MHKSLIVLILAGLIVAGILVAVVMQGPAETPVAPAPDEPETVDVAPEPTPKSPPAPEADADDAPILSEDKLDELLEETEPGADLRVYGTVTDAQTGAPVADAEVSHDTPSEPRPATSSDADGTFELMVSSGERGRLVCKAKGYARAYESLPAPSPAVRPAPAEGEAGAEEPSPDTLEDVRIDFMLTPGASVSGRVLDAATGEGVPDIRMAHAESGLTFIDRMKALGKNRDSGPETDENGAYTLDGLALKTYQIWPCARAAGYLLESKQVVTLDLKKNPAAENVDFVLEEGAVVQGRVTDMDGLVVAEADLQPMPADFVMNTMRDFSVADIAGLKDSGAETDDQGAYEIIGLDYDREYRLLCKADGFASTTSGAFTIERGASPAQLDITLTAGSRVSGRALYEDGQPAGGMDLILFPGFDAIFSGALREPANATTETDGTFAFDQVGAGKYTLRVSGDMDFSPFQEKDKPAPPTVEVDGIHDVTGVQLTVPQQDAEAAAAAVITGTVLSVDGAPMANVEVKAGLKGMNFGRWFTTTEEDGTFAFDKLKGQEFDLTVSNDEGFAELKAVSIGSDVTMRLANPTVVSGVVVTRDGDPAVECEVRLQSQEESSDDPAQAMESFMAQFMGSGASGEKTDTYGAFTFTNMAPGQYTVYAESKTDGAGESNLFSIQAGDNVTGIKIVLTPGSQFAGRVQDGHGAAVSGASVSLMPVKEGMADLMTRYLPMGMQKTAGNATSDAEGAFAIDNVVPGTYRVMATHDDFADTADETTIESGRNVTDFRMVMTPGGNVTGRYISGGEAKAGVMVQFIGPTGMQMTTTDGSGQFSLMSLAPGTYLVNAVDMSLMAGGNMADMMSITPRVVDIADGDDMELDLGDRVGGVAVGGAVTGEGLGNITLVSLRHLGGPAPEDQDPMDMVGNIEAARYLVGQAGLDANGQFQIEGVDPGTYEIYVFSFDMDMANPDMNAMMDMSRHPIHRQEIVVGTEPVMLQISVGPQE